MTVETDICQPGRLVRVTQQIAQRTHTWSIAVEGEVVSMDRKKTGSWFAHAKDDRLWLDRLTLRKSDGEIVVVHLDPYTRVQAVDGATPAK